MERTPRDDKCQIDFIGKFMENIQSPPASVHKEICDQPWDFVDKSPGQVAYEEYADPFLFPWRGVPEDNQKKWESVAEAAVNAWLSSTDQINKLAGLNKLAGP